MSEAARLYLESIQDWPNKTIMQMESMNPLLDYWWGQMSEAEKISARYTWESNRVFR